MGACRDFLKLSFFFFFFAWTQVWHYVSWIYHAFKDFWLYQKTWKWIFLVLSMTELSESQNWEFSTNPKGIADSRNFMSKEIFFIFGLKKFFFCTISCSKSLICQNLDDKCWDRKICLKNLKYNICHSRICDDILRISQTNFELFWK